MPPPALTTAHRTWVPVATWKSTTGNKVAFHVYAEGVQIYRWDGAGWVFAGPEAVLWADAGGHGVVGTHYAGPTWESLSGSTVRGTVVYRCRPSPTRFRGSSSKRSTRKGLEFFSASRTSSA